MIVSHSSGGELEDHAEKCLALPWTVAEGRLNTNSLIYIPDLGLFQLHETQLYPRLSYFYSARVTEVNKAGLPSGIN